MALARCYNGLNFNTSNLRNAWRTGLEITSGYAIRNYSYLKVKYRHSIWWYAGQTTISCIYNTHSKLCVHFESEYSHCRSLTTALTTWQCGSVMGSKHRSKLWLSTRSRLPKKFTGQPKILMQLSVDNHRSEATTNLCTCIYFKYCKPKNLDGQPEIVTLFSVGQLFNSNTESKTRGVFVDLYHVYVHLCMLIAPMAPENLS